MVLDELLDAVEQVQGRIREHGDSLRGHETRTRVVLIDPILNVLGWNVADPSLVALELMDGSKKRADYVLLASGTYRAIIEAKKLGEPLAGHHEQMLAYCISSSVPYAALTNGDRWLLYDVWSRKPLDEKRIVDVSVDDEPAHRAALQLLPLLRPNLASPSPVTEIATAEDKPPSSTPTLRHSSGDSWVPLSEYDPPVKTPPPAAIRFSDGDEQPVGKWNRLLICTAEKLLRQGMLSPNRLPVLASNNTCIVNRVPEHPSGKSFWSQVKIERRVFVEAGVSAKSARRWTVLLLRHFDLDPREVVLRVVP